MAKHVSTTSSRSTASAKSTPSKIRVTGAGVAALQATLSASLAALDKRTVTHAAAFQALDLIDQAIGDVTATSGVLDEIIVYCPSCYRERGPIELADERLRGRLFVGTRFVCSATRSYDSAVAPRPCGSLGHIIIRPPARDRIPPGRSIPWCSISCPRCVPCWEISQVRLDRHPGPAVASTAVVPAASSGTYGAGMAAGWGSGGFMTMALSRGGFGIASASARRMLGAAPQPRKARQPKEPKGKVSKNVR
jgi:hypothetical protein